MIKKISLIIKICAIFFLLFSELIGEEISIIPLKKPILDEVVKNELLIKGLIKPKEKPFKDIKKDKKKEDLTKQKNKPLKIKVEKKEENKIVKKIKKKSVFLTPKNKPLVVKKE